MGRVNVRVRGRRRSPRGATMEPPARRRAAARANGASWNEQTCALAARGGHLTVLQWARANGAPWNRDVCSSAALGDHLAVLQWSRLLAGERLRAPMAPHGITSYARTRPHMVISRCCNGHAPTVRRGRNKHACVRHEAVTLHCCNGAACSQASGCTCQRRCVGQARMRVRIGIQTRRGTRVEPPARRRAAARANGAP